MPKYPNGKMAHSPAYWGVRLGFGAGDFAQNLLYPAVAMYLLFFYTDVLGIAPSAAAAIFLAAQLVDFAWNPVVGIFVDRCNPKWGKYRTWLMAAGMPFAAFAVLCFLNPFGTGHPVFKVAYAAATYIVFSMLFTLVNVAYGALGASISRDTDEITALTAVRIFMANAACFIASTGIPLLVVAASSRPDAPAPFQISLFMGLGMLPSFVFMPFLPWLRRRLGTRGLFYAFAPVAVAGMAALYFLRSPAWICAAQFVKASGIIVATGHMWALVPEVVEYSERITGRRIAAIVHSIIGIFFRLGMAFGKILPGAVLAWTGYRAAGTREASSGPLSSLPAEPKAWFAALAVFAVAAAVCLVFSFSTVRERLPAGAQDSSRLGIGELWREFRRNRPLRVLAVFFLLAFAMMSTGNAAGAFFMNGLDAQPSAAQEGVRWLVCVIPALLISAAAFAIARFRL